MEAPPAATAKRKRGAAAADSAPSAAAIDEVSDAEVEEFYAILRRMRDASRRFYSPAARAPAWCPRFSWEDFAPPPAPAAAPPPPVEERVDENGTPPPPPRPAGIDLNAEPEPEAPCSSSSAGAPRARAFVETRAGRSIGTPRTRRRTAITRR